MSGKTRRLWRALAILALVGVAISSASLYHHFGTEKSPYCDFGQSFNCDVVNRSIYSVVMGVPVALIGLLGYLALLMLATFYGQKAETPVMLFISTLAGLGFGLYLTYVEAFVLAVWCVLCLSSLATTTAIAVVSGALMWEAKRSR